MDEALAQVAIDLSGRPYFVFEGQFGRDTVGQLPTELVPHFFRSLAETLGAAINIEGSGREHPSHDRSLFQRRRSYASPSVPYHGHGTAEHQGHVVMHARNHRQWRCQHRLAAATRIDRLGVDSELTTDPDKRSRPPRM